MAEEFGKYRLIKKIAQGGMAEVFLATQSAALPGFEKQIAIKRIFPNLATDENMRTMFLDEATIAARLNHPNIVQIYDVGEVDQYLFLAMEYVDGYDFRNVLVKAQQKGVSLPYPLAVNVIMNAAAGLHHAHALIGSDGKPMKVIHRDMSPQNILVSKGGNVKVCDFGVAKAEVRTGMTRAGELKGKISYMSPEQIEGAVEIDHRSDIFSLGVVLYEATTMTRLFRQGTDYEKMRNILDGNIKPPVEVTPGYPEDLQLIVLKCLANNRDDRYQTAKELQVALDGWLSKNGVSQSALELERFLAFLFEDAPISPSSEPGTSSFSALRGSISRKLVVPKLDALSSKSAVSAAFDQSPTNPSRIHTEGTPFVTGASNRSRLTNNFGSLSGIHSKEDLEAAVKSAAAGQRLGTQMGAPGSAGTTGSGTSPSSGPLPYFNGTQNRPEVIASGFSKRSNDIGLPEIEGSDDYPSEADEFKDNGDESSIAEAIPTSEYQVISRHAQVVNPQILQDGNFPPSMASLEQPPISTNPADNFEGVQHSMIKNAGPPPKRRGAPHASQLELNAEDGHSQDPPMSVLESGTLPPLATGEVKVAVGDEKAVLESAHRHASRPNNPTVPPGGLNNPALSTAEIAKAPPTSRLTASTPATDTSYVEPFDETVKKDGGFGSTIVIVLIVLGIAGGFIYFLMSGSPDKKDAAATDAAAQKTNPASDTTVVTKLSAYEPNVTWVVNGRIPPFADGNNVALPKGDKSLVTAFKDGFLPGSALVGPGDENPERINMAVDKGDTTGVLKITSTPPGADVYIDGKLRGKTPTDVPNLSTSFPHLVDIESDTNASYVGYIGVSGETPLDVILKTPKKPLQTDVNIAIKPDGATVDYQQNKETLPATSIVKPGTRINLANQDPRFYLFSYSVDTTGVGNVEFNFPMVPDDRSRATLTLRVEPAGTKIYVAGGTTAIKGMEKYPVVAGHLPIVLEGPDGRGNIDLEIVPNQENLYVLQLQGSEIQVKKKSHKPQE